MSRQAGRGVTVASFNTRGLPLFGSNLAERYRAIAAFFESSDIDVVNFQEVFTHRHLRLLSAGMPSFRHLAYRRALVGPAGGLVTLSRLPTGKSGYRRFPLLPSSPGLPRTVRFKAALKGALITPLRDQGVCVINTHPVANGDGDWSDANRFRPLQQGQLTALARLVQEIEDPVVVCGDFNVARDSTLHRDFLATTGLVDAFAGSCPPTFHSAYLKPGQRPHCIDFILVAKSIGVESTGTLFTDREPLAGGPSYLSDHIGLYARLCPKR
ncbi:endonuclease/exonuclease/phosphatase family protein [Thermomonospora curvata]|uniref:Endonuclease/exonuclease/phosphatase n=1 Tax=Thermomonospora curvata (strain ATCC 19995 / DSM 43183 / JCM 3096 / KCTC 9072 / NBRC 15933 / NCIMB 10081 / Henssen B9) TaxID=471852 RepID=D1A2E3_THECD|nr:endonuclease/exonuclease/phosphatase family protein [Thermomonospora curvata]ACY95963.1 Endonuclease/exonuclease/phosphatase [Thermomonospora curvata DSM 43183]